MLTLHVALKPAYVATFIGIVGICMSSERNCTLNGYYRTASLTVLPTAKTSRNHSALQKVSVRSDSSSFSMQRVWREYRTRDWGKRWLSRIWKEYCRSISHFIKSERQTHTWRSMEGSFPSFRFCPWDCESSNTAWWNDDKKDNSVCFALLVYLSDKLYLLAIQCSL